MRPEHWRSAANGRCPEADFRQFIKQAFAKISDNQGRGTIAGDMISGLGQMLYLIVDDLGASNGIRWERPISRDAKNVDPTRL